MLAVIFQKAVPFLMFFAYLIITFAFAIHAVGIQFDGTLLLEPEGEYVGFGAWYIPFALYTLRNSLGDFKCDTFLFLPKPVMYVTWATWLLLISINALIFLNFLISVINETYESIREVQI